MTIAPTPAPEGRLLAPLDVGQQVTAEDRRYTIQVPAFWVRNTVPPADIAYRDSGGTPSDTGFRYNVTREALPESVESVEEYAAARRQSTEDASSDVETLSMDPVQVAGTQAMRWIYTTEIASEPVLMHQVYVLDGDTGFTLTGSAPVAGDTVAATDLFDRIAGSFSFPRG